jgi:uncharacterized protein (TIGR01777 family)
VRVLVTGSSGLVGTELISQLEALGHSVVRWKRGTVVSGQDLETVDAIVNLAGATTGKLPWTKKYKKELIDSRIETTRMLVKAINECKNPPQVFVSGSASGFYGDTKEITATEETPKGTGFLSDLAWRWEEVAKEARTRVVLIRTTMVLSRKLGALGRLLPLIKLGVAGPLGSGKQWWAWISLPDEARAIIHLIETKTARGPFNLTAPESATCTQMIRSLGDKLQRLTIIPVPAFALRLAFWEGADELLLCNQKMTADKLLASGFKFEHPTLDSATTWVTKNPAN